MPEFPPTILYFAVSSKSETSPPCQTRNVLYLSWPSLVVAVRAPSFTDQMAGSPFQPSIVLPSNRDLASWANAVAEAAVRSTRVSARIMVVSGECFDGKERLTDMRSQASGRREPADNVRERWPFVDSIRRLTP